MYSPVGGGLYIYDKCHEEMKLIKKYTVTISKYVRSVKKFN